MTCSVDVYALTPIAATHTRVPLACHEKRLGAGDRKQGSNRIMLTEVVVRPGYFLKSVKEGTPVK